MQSQSHDGKSMLDSEFREMSDGAQDGLVPLKTLDLEHVRDFDEMLRGMALTAFGGRNLGEAAEVLEAMVTDPECSVVLTLSGAMTVAKMGMIITEMVERGWVQAIVSTGALMTHGLVELTGMEHYKAMTAVDDTELFHRGYNRVYDTYEMEKNLNDLQKLTRSVFDTLPEGRRFGSRHLCAAVGRTLERPGMRGIMVSCYRHGVPIYIPALSDSELGLDLATWLIDRRRKASSSSVEDILEREMESPYDPMLDLGHFARFVLKTPKLGIFTIGGGVPRNWAQQVSPFIDIVNRALDQELKISRYMYGVRICPEPVHWGGLSGCTYSEGVSWGKFVPPEEGGRFAEVLSDATTVWPLIVKGVAQRLEKSGQKPAHPAIDLDGCRPLRQA